jgi:hypothetical protein
MISILLDHPWMAKVTAAVFIAAVLGGGSTLITTAKDVSVLKVKAEEVTEVKSELRRTNDKLSEISRDLAVVADRIRREDKPSVPSN